MRDDSDLYYEDIVEGGRSASVVRDDEGNIAYPALVPPAIDTPNAVNDTAHNYLSSHDAAAEDRPAGGEIPDANETGIARADTVGTNNEQPTDEISSSGGPAAGSSPEGRRTSAAVASPGGKKRRRGDSDALGKTTSRRQGRDRSSTAPSQLRRAHSNVALIQELRRTPTLQWSSLLDYSAPEDDNISAPRSSSTSKPPDLEAGTATTGQQPQKAKKQQETSAGLQKTHTSFWKKQQAHRTKTGSSHHAYRNFLKSQTFRRDGRLPISVKDTSHTGVLAKAVGAAVRRIAPSETDDELSSDTEAELDGYASVHKQSDMSLAAAEYSRVSQTLAHQSPPKLNVVVMVIGSRGDIQPFLKIGKVLKEKYGHRVRIATHPAFRDFIEKDVGLEFFSVGGDPAELMAFMVKNPGMIPSLATVRSGDIGRRRDAMAEMFDGFWRACVDATDDPNDIHNLKLVGDKEPFIADAIIANPPSYVHIHCAEALGIPLHVMFTFPYTPTQAFPHPLANIKKSNVDPGYTNFISYPLIDMMVWQGLGDLVNSFRVKSLDLEPISMIWAPGAIYRMHVPFTYLWSPGLIPKPDDWGPEIDIGGFVFLDLGSSFKPPESLVKFLAESEEPPVYIGFGSIVVDDADSFTEMIFEAVRMAGVRALVSRGWGGFGGNGNNIPDNIYMLDNTPHDWLFPQVRGCVIHGGAGTTAIALKCGLPTMVVPFFGDQYFWGSMIEKAKVGPKPVPYKRLTAERLAEGIQYLLGKEARSAAQTIAASIEIEGDGAENACRSFMRTLELEGQNSMRCSIFPDRVAVWQRKSSNIKLSTLAAEALVKKGFMTYKNLRLIRHTEWNDFEGPGEPITAMFGSIARSFRDVISGPFSAVGQIFSSKKKNTKSTKDEKAKDSSNASSSNASNSNDNKADGTRRQSPNEPKDNSLPPDQNSGFAKDLAEADTLGDDEDSLDYQARSKAEDGSFDVVFSAVGKSVGKSALALFMAPIELYFALCQGFHNAPRLYGDDTVRRPLHVTGIKSGMKAAGNEFIFGIYDGVTGVVRLPIRGARHGGGVHGFVRGVGMGIMGFILKDISAIIGPLGFALKGLAKQAGRSGQPARYLRRARIMQAQREVRALGDLEWRRIVDKAVLSWETMHALFEVVQQGDHANKKAGRSKLGDEEANNAAIATRNLSRPAMPRSASNDSVFEHHHYHNAVSSSSRQSLEDLDAALENADLAAIVLAALRRGETIESVVRGRHSLPRRRNQCNLCAPPDSDIIRVRRKQLTKKWQEKAAEENSGGAGAVARKAEEVGESSGTNAG